MKEGRSPEDQERGGTDCRRAACRRLWTEVPVLRNRSGRSSLNKAPVEEMEEVPISQIKGRIADVIPPEQLFSVRIRQQILDIPARPITEKMPEVMQVVPQDQFQERTMKKILE